MPTPRKATRRKTPTAAARRAAADGKRTPAKPKAPAAPAPLDAETLMQVAADTSTEDLRAVVADPEQPAAHVGAAANELARRDSSSDGEDLDADLPPVESEDAALLRAGALNLEDEDDTPGPDFDNPGPRGSEQVVPAPPLEADGSADYQPPADEPAGYTPPAVDFDPPKLGVGIVDGRVAAARNPAIALASCGSEALERAGLELRNADLVVLAVPRGYARTHDVLKEFVG